MNQYHLSSILPAIAAAKAAGQTITLVTGVFDIIHQEHQNFLRKARAVGDLLIVGLESDSRVKQIKGPSRPINSQLSRAAALSKLPQVDHTFILPETFSSPRNHERLIAKIKPDILAVSSHTPHLQAKRNILNKFGGHVKIVHQHNPKISTTKVLQSPRVQN